MRRTTRGYGLALLLALPAGVRAETSWLDAEVRAQEARWAAQQGRTAPLAPVGTAMPGTSLRTPPALQTGPPPRGVANSPPPLALPSRPTGNGGSGISRVILASARQHRLDPLLVRAVVLTESAGRPRARSPKGARGLMQLMPATAARFGVADLDDPAQNIDGGARYLRWLLDRFGGNVTLALAGYNAGEGAVDRYGGIPPYRETHHYVRRVRATHAALGRILARKLARAGQRTSDSSRLTIAGGLN